MKNFASSSTASAVFLALGIAVSDSLFSMVLFGMTQMLWLKISKDKVGGFLEDETERYDLLGYFPSVISLFAIVLTIAAIFFSFFKGAGFPLFKFVAIATTIETALCLFSIYSIRLFLLKKGLVKKI